MTTDAAVTYKTCPKCKHERGDGDTGPAGVCPACGLIFSKYLHSRATAGAQSQPHIRDGRVDTDNTGVTAAAKGLFFHVPDEVESLHVYVRAALLAALVLYGLKLAAMAIPSWELSSSLIHLPMVPIHEFGHVLFRPFGEFIHLLGGSLFQVGLPHEVRVA
jgi:hypothetical protein